MTKTEITIIAVIYLMLIYGFSEAIEINKTTHIILAVAINIDLTASLYFNKIIRR